MVDKVLVKAGEVLRFPVDSGHPYARHQKITPLAKFGALHDLGLARNIAKANPRLSASQVSASVQAVLSSADAGGILQLDLPDITIQPGATMVIAGPVSTLNAGRLNVLGELLIHGHLDLTCDWLGAQDQPTITSIAPASGPTGGFTSVLIMGDNLDDIAEVYFGGVPALGFDASIVGEIQASSPGVAGAGPVDISVVTNSGLTTSPTPAAIFTYLYLPGVEAVTIDPPVLWTGSPSTGVVVLNEPAPPEGSTVALWVDFPATATIPDSVAVAGGATSASFPIVAADSVPIGIGAVTITATGPDQRQASTTCVIATGQLALVIPAAEALEPSASATGTVCLNGPAPDGGAQVALSVGQTVPRGAPALALPATVAVAAGETSATFTLRARERFYDATVTASYGGDTATAVVYGDPPSRPPPSPPPGGPPGPKHPPTQM